MSAAGTLRSMGAVAWSEVRAAMTSVRVVMFTSIFGFPSVLLAYALGGSATGGAPATFPLWRLGPDGALLALAYGFAPLLLPAIPLGLAYDVARRDLRSGYPETLLTRPVPRWSAVLGRVAGLVAACSVLILIVDTASVAALSGAAGASASTGLSAAFVGATLVLGALYLIAGLVLLVVLTPSQFAWLALPLWAYHHAVRPLSLVISGQFLQILPIPGPVVFAAAWSDLASFTGLYMGLLAPATPPGAGLAILPTVFDFSGSVAFTAVSLAGLPLIGFLVILYLAVVSRMPLGR
ncbi:MAG: hypothetical protein ACT4OI_06900 [Methanobacteriota archaeon]